MSNIRKTSRLFAVLLVLAMVITLLPMAAFAKDSVSRTTTVMVRVFGLDASDRTKELRTTSVELPGTSGNAYDALTSALDEVPAISYNIDSAGIIQSINGLTPEGSTYEKPAWLYFVNNKMAGGTLNQTTMTDGDVLTVFFAMDVDNTFFTYIEPTGAPAVRRADGSVKFIQATDNEDVYLRLIGSSVNFADLRTEEIFGTITPYPQKHAAKDPVRGSARKIPTGTTHIEGRKLTTSSGPQLIPARLNVSGIHTITQSTWRTEQLNGYASLSDLEKAEVDQNIYNAVNNNTAASFSEINALADQIYEAIRCYSLKLSRLTIKDTNDEYLNMTQAGNPFAGFDPNVANYDAGTVPANVKVYYSLWTDGGSVDPTVYYEVSEGTPGTYSNTLADGATVAIPNGPFDGRIWIKIENDLKSEEYSIAVQRPGPSPTEAGVYAYIPAPGQFTNEGVTVGGWGDIFTADGTLKHNEATGVSLGYFGGSYVYDFGATPKTGGGYEGNVKNDASNEYGVDFIVYGNAFWGNSEPGGIQVAQAVSDGIGGYKPGDAKGDGIVWYDIAGSLYYTDDSTPGYSVTYTHPNPSENLATVPANNMGNPLAVQYNWTSPSGSGSGTVATNPFHNHSWFPFNCNYFEERNNLDYPMHRPGLLNTFSAYDYTDATGAATLTLSGVLLSNVSTNLSTKYLFGYCDAHPNRTLGSGVAYNPYGIASVTDSQGYNAYTENKGGGDPIDISWAVEPAYKENGTLNPNVGKPVDLGDITFVRIYTAAAQDNPPFGEISTEVCSVAAATGTGSGAATTDLVIIKPGTGVITTTNGGYKEVPAGALYIRSSEDNVYLNGAPINASGSPGYQLNVEAGKYYQIITQNGTESPYITVLKGI
ncbi:MAG: DUF4430 domain-containing protein [Clostridiales bacterium]|nr:DUF4430 domain-containing protein [Clostridiales bacterium]